MEWQAGYVSGAILMPIARLQRLVQVTFDAWGAFGSVPTASVKGADLIARVAGQFGVSNDAAKVRLAQLGYLTDRPEERSLELG